jgi:hypothetical protein
LAPALAGARFAASRSVFRRSCLDGAIVRGPERASFVLNQI